MAYKKTKTTNGLNRFPKVKYLLVIGLLFLISACAVESNIESVVNTSNENNPTPSATAEDQYQKYDDDDNEHDDQHDDDNEHDDQHDDDNEHDDQHNDAYFPEDPNNTTPVTFTENVHSSLPEAWVTEYNTIKENLLTIFPLYQKYYSGVVVYAWNDNVDDPYSGVQGGAYISIENGDASLKKFVMEIPNRELIENGFHRYSVIVHEYFHCYQLSLNPHANKPNAAPTSFDTKWLIEGPAAVVEGMYTKQYYGNNYTVESQNRVHPDVFTSPTKLESHDTSMGIDENYSSSIFLVLVLAKELQNSGLTEAESFQLILRDYMASNPNKDTWKTLFTEMFNMTLDEFYAKLPNYSGQKNADILPTATLKLEDIF
jgi:hypothetical protein